MRTLESVPCLARALIWAMTLGAMACSDSSTPVDQPVGVGGGGGGVWDPDSNLGSGDGANRGESDDDAFAEVPFTGPQSPQEACDRWTTERDVLVPGSWSGQMDGCQAGDLSREGRQSALGSLNLYRWLAGLPPVETDSSRDVASQECALMIEANSELNNNPPADWQCLTPAGKEATYKSQLAFEDAVAAVDYFMVNPAQSSSLTARRALLSTVLGPIGIGSTGESTCFLTAGGSAEVTRLFVSWPPAGPVPITAFSPGFGSPDETGWSVHSDTLDLSSATVKVTQGGQVMPVTTAPLGEVSGSFSGISFTPDGWTTLGGRTYRIEVSDVAEPFAYEVETVICN